jgi:ribose transport system substrate-binding protein
MGVDVIAISPIEVEVVKPVLQRANEAGIPIIMVNLLEPIEGVEIASYIGFDNFDAAAITAYAVVDYFGGPGVLGEGEMVDAEPGTYLDLEWWETLYADVDPAELDIQAKGAIIEGVAGGFFSATRVAGFRSVIDKYPGIVEVMEPIPADWNREKGITAAEDILTANPAGELDFIWAASNEMGMGARLAAETADRTEVAVFTNDVTPESVLEFINKDRIIAETTHGFPDWGWFGTKYAVMLALGLDVPEFEDIRPRIAYKDNSSYFYPKPELPPIDWDDILKQAGLK